MTNESKKTTFKVNLKDNLQVIIAIFAVASALFSVFNFYLSSQLYPLTKRVEAIETWKEEVKPDIKSIPVILTKLDALKEDTTDIKSFLKIR
jgi:Tfp pilus assembly protein PilO